MKRSLSLILFAFVFTGQGFARGLGGGLSTGLGDLKSFLGKKASPDSQYMLSLDEKESKIDVIIMKSGKTFFSIPKMNSVARYEFLDNDRILIISKIKDDDCLAKIFDLKTKQLLPQELRVNANLTQQIYYSPDNKLLIDQSNTEATLGTSK